MLSLRTQKLVCVNFNLQRNSKSKQANFFFLKFQLSKIMVLMQNWQKCSTLSASPTYGSCSSCHCLNYIKPFLPLISFQNCQKKYIIVLIVYNCWQFLKLDQPKKKFKFLWGLKIGKLGTEYNFNSFGIHQILSSYAITKINSAKHLHK